MKKFTYKIFEVSGGVVKADFCSEGITVEIEGEKISEATDAIRQYLADNFLKYDRIELIKIEISK
jgi:hypothetical protein